MKLLKKKKQNSRPQKGSNSTAKRLAPKARTTASKKDPKSDSYHHGDLQTTLIETAVKMLRNRSPAEISLRELAREAGVSQAAPYRHFKDKNQLLAAVCQQGFDLKFQYMVEAVKKAKSAKDLIIQCGLAYFQMGLKYPQHFKLMVNSEIKPSPEYPLLEQSACKTFILLKQVIERCQKAGIMGDGNPYHRAMNCWCVVNGFTSLYAEGRLEWLGVTPENAEHALKTLLNQYLSGALQPIKESDFGFKIFSTDLSQVNQVQMEQLDDMIKELRLISENL